MANKSISQLTSGGAIASTDLFPDVQTVGVGPVKVTALQLGTYALTGVFDAGFTFNTTTKSLTLGVQSTTAGSLVLANANASAYATTVKSSDSASAAWTLTLPVSAGTNGYLLTTNGSGVTAWTNPTALGIDLDIGTTVITGGTTGRVLYDNAGVLGEYSITGTAGSVVLSTGPTFTSSITLGTQQTTQGSIVLANTAAGAFATTLQASNSASAAWTLTLPTTAGTNGYLLTTNGSGVTSWTNPTALGIDLDVGTTAITNGTTGRVLYDNAGVLGEYTSVPVGFGGTGTSTAFTAGSVVFAGASGTYSQNNSQFFWDNTNNRLGIGTASPSSAVHISAASPVLRIADTTASGGVAFIGTDTTGLFFRTFTADTTRFQNAAGTINLSIDTIGNLLVGTTANGFNGQGAPLFVGSGSGSTGMTIYSGATGYGTIQFAKANTSGSDSYRGVVSYNHASDFMYFSTAATERMRIDSSGNVLVGGTAARGTTVGTAHLDIFNGTAPAGTLTNGISLYSSSGDFYFMDAAGSAYKVGFRNVPAVGTKTSSYQLATADVGKYVQVSTGGSITIPDTTFAEGDIISIFNNTTGNITITCSITTAYIAGTDTDKATMTLATRGVATVLFISSTVCVVSGNVS